MKTAFISNNTEQLYSVYSKDVIETIKSTTDLYDVIISSDNVREHIDALKNVDFFFSTWGIPNFDDEIIDEFKNLKCIFYAASSVKHFAEPYLARGVKIVNAGFVNGAYVANYTFAQIMLAAKGFFLQTRIGDEHAPYSLNGTDIFGCYNRPVGVLGAGNIGKEVIKKLVSENMIPYVYDPYLTNDQAKEFGAIKATVDEIFENCIVISNHTPKTPETNNMIGRKQFELMQSGATFINTANGNSVNEEEFVEVFKKRNDIIALLDVVVTEPLPEESPINRLNNVFRTPHIAGAHGSENNRMAVSCVNEMNKFIAGESLKYEITAEMLKTMA